MLEQAQHLLAEPTAEFLRLGDGDGRHQGAGDQAVADIGIEIIRSGA